MINQEIAAISVFESSLAQVSSKEDPEKRECSIHF